MANDDIPWEVLKRRGHESVRLMELTRYICRQKRRETQRIEMKERRSRKMAELIERTEMTDTHLHK